MTYGAVVLYYRLGERIHDTIAALLAQTLPAERIVVIDNASNDGVLDEAETRYPSCTILRMQSNLGYATAMNAGAARLIGDVDNIVFLTHEVVMEPDCANRLTSALEDDPDLGMVGPALRLHGTELTWSLGGMITRFGGVRHNLSTGLVDEVHWLDGACLFTRTSAFVDSGGFDEDYFLYWEDVDISLKVRQSSHICCVPEAIAYQGTATAPIYFRTRNQILCWRKRRSITFVLGSVFIALAKAIFVDLGGRSPVRLRARLLGVVDGFTGRLTSSPIRMLRERN